MSNKYIDKKTKLKVRCENDHIWNPTPDALKQGKWCRICAGNAPLTLKQLQETAKKHNGLCLSDNPARAIDVIQWKCVNKDHPPFPARVRNVRNRNSWCPKCAGNEEKTIEDIRKIARQMKGKCLSRIYLGANKELEWQCEFGHAFHRTPNHVINEGRWCRNKKCKSQNH